MVIDNSVPEGRAKFEKMFGIAWKEYWAEIVKAHDEGYKYTCKKVARHRLGLDEFYDPDTFTEKFIKRRY